MADPTAIIGASVAGLAAVFSGSNLWISGKRDERRWRRDALIETLIDTLDASFSGTRWQLTDGEEEIGYRPSDAAYREVRFRGLTRLRLIAPNKVVAAAIELHAIDQRIRALADDRRTQVNESELNALRRAQAEARLELLSTARRTIGLDRALDAALMSKPGAIRSSYRSRDFPAT